MQFNRRGFTALELIIVISMIGILMAVFFAKSRGEEDMAKITASVNEIQQIYEAIQRWRIKRGQYNYSGISNTSLVTEGVISSQTLKENPFGRYTLWNAGYSIWPYGNGVRIALEADEIKAKCKTRCTRAMAIQLCKNGFTLVCYNDAGVFVSDATNTTNCPSWIPNKITCN